MCGIAGFCCYDQLADRRDLEAVIRLLSHRGPDGVGLHIDGSVALGMTRLAIIDLEGGDQPIANEARNVFAFQNGEIYNYRELRAELEGLGHRFLTDSDTEAIVHAYEQWGGWNFAEKLRGMFAIAIWDAREKQLWLVRDRIGIKPLYFSRTSRGFAYSSELNAITASPVVDPQFEPRALEQYLAYGSAGIDDTFFKDVYQLRPGHVLRHSHQAIQIRPYWKFQIPAKSLSIDETEASEILNEKLQTAIRTHLISDVPVGAFLSGGVDSSAIVGLMASQMSQPIQTFSIGFEEHKFNELPYAEQVARRWGTRHHFETVRPDAVGVMEEMLDHFGEPFADASALPTWYLSRLAARHVKVAISGDGGDELFAGYSQHARAMRDMGLDVVPAIFRRSLSALHGLFPPYSSAGRFCLYAGLDALGRYSFRQDLFPSSSRTRLLRDDFRAETLGAKDPTSDRISLMQSSDAPNAMSKLLYHDMLRYLPLDILAKVDRMSMAHGLEVRPPLLDHELVEFVASLPISMKITNRRRQKHIFKEAVRDVVPTILLDRKKAGFCVPLHTWFAGPLADQFQDEVLSGGQVLNYLNAQEVRYLFNENRQGRNHGLRLWSLLILERWLRRMSTVGTFAACEQPSGATIKTASDLRYQAVSERTPAR